MTFKQFRALEAATTSADEFPWSMIALDGDELRHLVESGVLIVVQGNPFDPLAAGNVYKLSDAGVVELRRRMRLLSTFCGHLDIRGGVCVRCGAFFPLLVPVKAVSDAGS